jgi:limonene-1,2-epoxide hydrolase
MSDAQSEVLAFFEEWGLAKSDMIEAMRRRFTPETVWENVGVATTVGFDQAMMFLDGFSAQFDFERGEVIVHNIATAGNVVLTERTDNFYDAAGKQIVSIKLMGIFEMQGSKILAWRDYFDTKGGF